MCGSVKEMYPGAAVFCAADGCDHRDCHGGPFRLVFVFTDFSMDEPYPYDNVKFTRRCSRRRPARGTG